MSILRVFHGLYDFSLKSIAFLEQFVHAFGSRVWQIGKSLQTPCLAA